MQVCFSLKYRRKQYTKLNKGGLDSGLGSPAQTHCAEVHIWN